jgi:pimeloyl-ACP methyl ester carboxylesterase
MATACWRWTCPATAGVRHAALAGHSLGSLVALEAASRAPERVTQLAMLGTCVPMPVPQALLDLSQSDVMAAIDRVVTFSFSTLAAKPSYPGPGVWLRGAGRALMRQVMAAQGDALLFHADFTACNSYRGGLDAAARVACPSALVLGAADQMTLPRNAREIALRLKATVHTVPAGHALMQESPDPVLAALRATLERSPTLAK